MDDEAALDVATVHSTIVIADPFYFDIEIIILIFMFYSHSTQLFWSKLDILRMIII